MGDITSFMPVILIFAIMYFLILRPQVKKQKEVEKMRNEVKAGDQIITNGGLYAKITSVDEESKTVKIKIDNSTTAKLDKSAISTVITDKK